MVKLFGQKEKYLFTFNSMDMNFVKFDTMYHRGIEAEVVIEEIGIYDEDEYEEIINDLRNTKIDMSPNIKELMKIDKNNVFHCCLITTHNNNDGLLIQTNNTNYAVFTAYVEDILVESYN